MDYQVNHRTETHGYELDRIELPSAAEALINRHIQLNYQVRQQPDNLRQCNVLNNTESSLQQKDTTA